MMPAKHFVAGFDHARFCIFIGIIYIRPQVVSICCDETTRGQASDSRCSKLAKPFATSQAGPETYAGCDGECFDHINIMLLSGSCSQILTLSSNENGMSRTAVPPKSSLFPIAVCGALLQSASRRSHLLNFAYVVSAALKT